MDLHQRTPPSRITIPPTLLEKAAGLYEAGLYLQAEKLLRPLGEPKDWEGVEARLFGARLAGNLGGRRLAAYLLTTLFRKHPEMPEVRYYWASHVFSQRGPWAAWEVLRDAESLPGLSQEMCALMDGMRGRICAFYKDQQRARTFLEKAQAEGAGIAWLKVEESFALEYLDEREAALLAAREARKMAPWYRPAVQQEATLLLSANRDAEALALLREASERIESGVLVTQQIVALSERECFSEIPALCDRAQGLLAWAEKEELEWLNARRSDAFYGLKDRRKAARYAREAGDAPWAERLEAAGAGESGEPEEEGRRVKLDVPFVQQAKDTCAPASLASVAAFWGWDVTHDEITKAVCYGGTEVHGLRRWVEDRSWVVREFQVTWESTQQLIDRGIPFLLVTREAGSGHMQVVEGYDSLRRTLLIRDPGFRHHRQVPAGEFLDFYAAFGPQGLVILPPAESGRLEGVELAAEGGFNRLYHLHCALERHDRERAAAEHAALKREGPQFLAFEARLTLSFYDADEMERLRCLEEMEASGLHHPRLTAMLLAAQENFSTPSKRLETLRKAADPRAWDALSRWTPSFLMTLAMQLAPDERNYPEVRRLVRRYLALAPHDSGALSFWGGQLWLRKRYTEAIDLFRFAATGGPTLEAYAHEYFHACFLQGREEEALELLRERVAGSEGRSSYPAQTFYSALRSLHRSEAAFAVLSKALQSAPEDAELLLYAAYEWALSGEREKGREILLKARGLAKPASWARVAARFAALEGDLEGEAAQWSEVMRLEPLALDAYAAHCRLILAREGPEAAVEAGKAKCEAFPHHVGFAEYLARVALEAGDAAAEPFVLEWNRKAPHSFAAHREKVRLTLARGEEGEAYFEAREKCTANPHSSEAAVSFGVVLYQTGRPEEARLWFRKAVSLNVDFEEAIRYLAALAVDEHQGRQEEAFVGAELEKQVFQGAGLYAWYDFAVHYLSGAAMREKLHWLRRSRPNCSAVWACSLRQSFRHHQINEALRLAEEATERFGLFAPAWLDLASALQRAGRIDEAAQAVEKALTLDPFLSAAWESLSSLREMQGRPDEAEALLEEAIRRNPLDDGMQAVYAYFLWRHGKRERALEVMEASLRRAPKGANGWWSYGEWCREMGDSQRAIALLEELVASRPGEVGLQTEYARTLRNAGYLDRAEEQLRPLLEVHRREPELHLLLSEILASKGKFDDAMELVTRTTWKESPNVAIMGQAAMIEACRGDLPEAIARLKATVRRDPSYVWGFEKLRDWNQDDLPEARRFAEKAAERQPNNAQAWMIWADIEEQLGNSRRALELHAEAVARNRADTGVAFLLIRRLLRHGEPEKAEEMLTQPPQFSEGERLAARAMMLLARNQKKEAWELTETLACRKDAAFAFTVLAQWYAERGYAKDLSKRLDRVVRQPGLCPHAVTIWVDAKLAAGKFNLVRTLRGVPEEHGAWKAGVEYYLRRLDELPLQHRGYPYAIWRKDRARIRQEVTTWESMGICMVAVRLGQTREWAAGWRDYFVVQPWTLRLIAMLAIARRELDEAFEVSEAAVAQGIYDDSMPLLRLVRCLKIALESDTKEAAEALAAFDGVALDPLCKIVRRIVRLTIDIREVSPEHGRNIWRREIAALKAEGADQDIVVRRLLQMTGKRLNLRGIRYFSLGRFSPWIALSPQARNPRYRRNAWISLAFLAVAMILALLGKSASHGGNQELYSALSGFGGLAMIPFVIFWLLAQMHYFSGGERWSLNLIARVLMHTVVPLVAASGIFGALTSVSQERDAERDAPRRQQALPTPAARAPQVGAVYHHPDGLVSVDLKDFGEAMVSKLEKQPTMPREGIVVRESNGTVTFLLIAPLWTWPNPPANPADFIDLELRKVKDAPNAFLAGEVVDEHQVRWLRFGMPKANPQGEKALMMHDITVAGDHLVIIQSIPPAGKYSVYDSEPLGKLMDRWHPCVKVTAKAAQPLPSPAGGVAAKESEETAALPPLMETDLFKQATALGKQGRHQEALPLLKSLRKERRNDITLISRIVETLAVLGKNVEAIGLAREGVQIAPEKGLAHGTLGYVLLRNGRAQEAVEANRKATELSPEEGAFWYCLGLSHMAMKEFPKAVDPLSKAIGYGPGNDEAWYQLYWAFQELKDPSGAERQIRKLLEAHPGSAAGWYVLGCAQGEMGQPTEEMASLKKAVALNPRNGLAWNALGLSHAKRGEADEAFRAFNESIRINPKDPNPWNNLGYTHLANQQPAEAQRAFEKAIEVQPAFTRAYVNLVDSHLQEGNREAARAVCRRLTPIDPALAGNLSLKIEGKAGTN